MLHVAQISFYFDPERREPERLLIDWPSLVDIADAARSGGTRVSVVQAAIRDAHIHRDGVDYHFIAPSDPTASIASGNALQRLLERLQPDVLHVHGLGFPADVLALRRMAPRAPILLQDHADRAPRIWRRPLWREALSTAAGVAFCSRMQARPFIKSRVLPETTAVYEIPESTSRFTPGDQDEARQRTGVYGKPCVLWVGHLNENKDPLTVLDGIARVANELRGFQMWCCFGTAPLLARVRKRIHCDDALRGRVHLLGRVPHGHIEELMRAADIFVLGSHREGSGYSVIEALACGLPPVVTDIPSFRALTGAGKIGRLWRCDDAADLGAALRSVAATLNESSKRAVREHFEAELSMRAVGVKLAATYAALLRGTREHENQRR